MPEGILHTFLIGQCDHFKCHLETINTLILPGHRHRLGRAALLRNNEKKKLFINSQWAPVIVEQPRLYCTMMQPC